MTSSGIEPANFRLHYRLSPLCRVFTIISLKQTMFLGYILLQLFCIYDLLLLLLLYYCYYYYYYYYLNHLKNNWILIPWRGERCRGNEFFTFPLDLTSGSGFATDVTPRDVKHGEDLLPAHMHMTC